jgi:hypothetical protein
MAPRKNSFSGDDSVEEENNSSDSSIRVVLKPKKEQKILVK